MAVSLSTLISDAILDARWGATMTRELIDFSSNDYLDLSSDPRLAQAAAQAARRWGCGAGASALVSGWSPPLRALERDLAAWKGSEAALVFSSGFAANLALAARLAQSAVGLVGDLSDPADYLEVDPCGYPEGRRGHVEVPEQPGVGHPPGQELLDDLGAQRRWFPATYT